jgi:hypothetical protein
MKKIPTLFVRRFENHRVTVITNEVTPGFEWVLEGDGLATIKYDGACCAIFDGTFYKRYDAKHGKKPPEGAIPCCEPDPVTGHWPHWVKVTDGPADKWFREAFENAVDHRPGTYEAVGLHFQNNPYDYPYDTLIRHGAAIAYPERSFEGIREYLRANAIEGLVFWKDGEPQCKIKRTDFGFKWPLERE